MRDLQKYTNVRSGAFAPCARSGCARDHLSDPRPRGGCLNATAIATDTITSMPRCVDRRRPIPNVALANDYIPYFCNAFLTHSAQRLHSLERYLPAALLNFTYLPPTFTLPQQVKCLCPDFHLLPSDCICEQFVKNRIGFFIRMAPSASDLCEAAAGRIHTGQRFLATTSHPSQVSLVWGEPTTKTSRSSR